MNAEQLYRMPKIDLHNHLEGSIRPETIWEEAARLKIELPAADFKSFLPYVRYQQNDERSLVHFLTKFDWRRRILTNAESIARVTFETIEDAARQNAEYLEIRFNPAGMFLMGCTEEEIADGLRQGIVFAKERYDTRTAIICGLARDRGREYAERSAAFAIRYAGDLIRGIDLFGSELCPAEPFRDLLLSGKRSGLHLTVHAGEACGAENVREAISIGAERIGHGVRAVEDPETVKMAIDQNVMFEMCPTSNVQTGAVSSIEAHPLASLLRAGAHVCVNTDDQSVSDTNLTEEYRVSTEDIGLTETELKQSILDASDYIFADEYRTELKNTLREKFSNSISKGDNNYGV